MTTELHTNDEPQRILLEASERIKACYPPGTRIEVQIAGELFTGRVLYRGDGRFDFWPDKGGCTVRFIPSIHPHRVLP